MTTPPPIYAAAIIEDPDGRVLIVLPYDETGPDRRWRFPIGRVRDGESPEAAMRRITRSDLGVDVDIAIGQPPITGQVGGRPAVVRFFFCSLAAGEPTALACREVRWVAQGHLREYDYDPVSRRVADWLLDA